MTQNKTKGGIMGRIFLIIECLVVLGWVCLLFQYNPHVEAISSGNQPLSQENYLTLQRSINDQLSLFQQRSPLPIPIVETSEPIDQIFHAIAVNEGLTSEVHEPPETEIEPTEISLVEDNERQIEQVFQPLITGDESEGLVTPLDDYSITEFTPTTTHEVQTASTSISPRTPEPEQSATPPPCPYRLTTIIRGGRSATAVVVNLNTNQSSFVSVGQQIGVWEIIDISQEQVFLQFNSTQRILSME